MDHRNDPAIEIDRRAVLVGAACACIAGPTLAAAGDDTLPQKGDMLVFADGDLEGKPIPVEAVKIEAEPIVALAAPADTGVARTGSRFGKVVLVRLAPETIDAETSPNAIDGVVALSAICTHQGCTVNGWNPELKSLLCFCHGSQFFPGQGGKVAHGPARKRLPLLPIAKNDAGVLTVADGFLARPGPSA